MRDDALLLERSQTEMRLELGQNIHSISRSRFSRQRFRAYFKTLANDHGFEIVGIEIFLQAAVNDAGRHLR